MTKTANDMIRATLKTKSSKPAKNAEALRALGYTVEPDEYREYWSVNGLSYSNCGSAYIYDDTAHKTVADGIAEINNADYVNYLAIRYERTARRNARNAQGNITSETHYHVKKAYKRGSRFGEYVEYKRRYHNHYSQNKTIEHYKTLKNRESSFSGEYGGADWEISYHEGRIASIEEKIKSLKLDLVRERENLATAKAKKAEGSAALNDFLVAKGIR